MISIFFVFLEDLFDDYVVFSWISQADPRCFRVKMVFFGMNHMFG